MRFLSLAALACLTAPTALADEGMWLFNKLPAKQLQEKYQFPIEKDWLEHLQKSSVKFGGGSGSFVSPQGLILTNHHVGAGILQKLSTEQRDLLKDGFYAATLADELPCPDMELNVLMSIEDVTEKVNAAVKSDLSPEAAYAARRAVIAEIESESLKTTGLHSDVVTLYQGGAYHLYRYHRYTDVRLVFAPDRDAAAFGGDPDNFEYPRFCLDLAFFRAYEDGKPAKTDHYLKWNTKGAGDGELIFVSGHPGRTNRSNTLAQLEQMRDDGLPSRLEQSFRSEVILSAWGSRDRENQRRVSGSIVSIQNGRKSNQARLEGLLDPAFMAKKAADEEAMKKAFAASADWKEAAAAFDQIAEAEQQERAFGERSGMLEGGGAFSTSLFGIARTLIRAAEETPKPDGERLREFQASNRVSLELRLFSKEPVYKDLEIVKLTNSLTLLCEKLGASDPLVVKIMAGKSPRQRADELISETNLENIDLRKSLYADGGAALAESTDPMIALARLVDEEARALRQQGEGLAEKTVQAHQKIAQAKFALEGDSNYPDATSSLRLTFGVVKGYEEGGQQIPFETTLGGLFDRAERQGNVRPFVLPERWSARKDQVKLETPFNFVCTADITGGNSGSPVVNRSGELVGLIFDGNFSSLVTGFGYTEVTGRAVSVHSAGMLEALKSIYQTERLVEELTLVPR